MALLSGLGLFGTLLSSGGRRLATGKGKGLLLMAGLALLVGSIGFTVACGSNSSHPTAGNNQVTLMVTGMSGAIQHSIPVTVTVH